MELISPEYGTTFYVLTLVVSGGLFFLYRRFFRARLATESAALLATVLAAVVSTPLVLLALLWLVHVAASR